MAQKKSKDRKGKVDAFKNQQKANNALHAQPKTHLIPDVEFESTDNLDLRGDIAEAIEMGLGTAFLKLREANDALQRAGRAYQLLLGLNIKSGKAKLTYKWNNGDNPTAAEIADYEAKAKQYQEDQAKQQQNAEAEEKIKGTGLVTVDGTPLTETNLEEAGKGKIII
jgi:hypothetical protein